MVNKQLLEQANIKEYVAQLKPSLCGKLFYYLLPFRKKVVLKNINLVFGDYLTPTEITVLAQSFYSHIFKLLTENLCVRFMSQKKMREHAELVDHEAALEIAEKYKGMIILTAHLGNWEYAPLAGILNFKQFHGRLNFIRKGQSIGVLEKILFRRFHRAGLRVVPSKNSLNKIFSLLNNKQAVVFIMDQHANANRKDATLVEFFGQKTGTLKSLAMIAKYTEIPVVPAFSYRRADNKHVLQFLPPLTWQPHDDLDEEITINTRIYNQTIEQMILAHPEQWLWMYKRWKEDKFYHKAP